MKKITMSALALLLSLSVLAQSQKTSRTSTESTSVSVSNSDHEYSVVATFNTPKTESLKRLLTQRLGNPSESRGNILEWSAKNSYTVTLRAGKLIIDMNKDQTNTEMIKIFERLGEDIQPTLEAKI